MLIFVSILLLLLWLFQIVFLDDFYRSIKFNRIKGFSEGIERNIENQDIESLLSEISNQNDICIRIVNLNGINIYNEEVSKDCIIHKLSPAQIYNYYVAAEANNNTYYEVFTKENVSIGRDGGGYFFESLPKGENSSMENIVYVRLVPLTNGNKVMVMLNSNILPVNSTTETLRIQLIYISIILFILSMIIAFLISKRVSSPIVAINSSAKELAKGNYDTTFKGEGYQEIRELNNTLNYAAKELSKVEGLRRELIANISHDLRTPLTMITGYGEVMRDIPGENTPENVQIIIDEAKRLTTLVNDILDISKFQSGNQVLKIEDFNLTKSIEEILLRYNKLTEQNGYKIIFTHDEDVIIQGDEVKLSQVIYNLINNAITYTGEDKTVTLRQIIEEDWVKIEVIDSGEGIPEEDIPLIWDRYYKVNKTHKRAAIGTGLGLSIVKEILQLHEAEFGVESSLGEGSCFYFKLRLPKEI